MKRRNIFLILIIFVIFCIALIGIRRYINKTKEKTNILESKLQGNEENFSIDYTTDELNNDNSSVNNQDKQTIEDISRRFRLHKNR